VCLKSARARLQAAVLAELGADVYSIEILAPLRDRAVDILARLGYGQVKTRVGDGYLGWPEAAPSTPSS